MNQLAKRVLIEIIAANRFIFFRIRLAGADCDPAIAREAAVHRLERRDSAQLPFARCRPLPRNGHGRVAERRPHGESPLDSRVYAIVLARLGQRSADHRAARNPLDPGDLARWAALPAKQRRRKLGGTARPRSLSDRRSSRRSRTRGGRWFRRNELPILTKILDPGEDFADRWDGHDRRGRRRRWCLFRLRRQLRHKRFRRFSCSAFHGSRLFYDWRGRNDRRTRSEVGNVGMHRANELPAFGAGSIVDLLPLVGPELDCGKDRRRYRNRVGSEREDELDRKLRLGNRSRGGRPNLRIDDDGFASNFEKRQLGRSGRQVIGPREQLDELPPPDRAVVRIGGRLRQHCVQAIVEPHRRIRFLQDRSFPDLVARAPTEGVAA